MCRTGPRELLFTGSSSGYFPQKPTWIRILPGRNCHQPPDKGQKIICGQGITWPHTSFSASPAVEASRASLASPGSESAPHSTKRPWLASQGRGLNPQPHQTRIVHLGAAVAATFLRDKAVQEALERAGESCRQRIFSLRSPSLWNIPRENKPLENTANPYSWCPSPCLWREHPIWVPALLFVLILWKMLHYHRDSTTRSKDGMFFLVGCSSH